MGLSKVWVRTLRDGLVRADQIIGVSAHTTPALAGKPSHWLVDATLAVSAGSGARDSWDMTLLHRTLIQTPAEPVDAPEACARLLASLQESEHAGIITPVLVEGTTRARVISTVRFEFTPFDCEDR
ncbi:hypothetical protein [Nocardia transvalensis]|uniref:hypothetical protein n=1 Tax=Nocardia transvalensis TaxID=37333 RepID=UPI001892DC26|nr:hypothetical protein [Nocardia transvalensis]MBF6329775.1 hypothetical protein [Nocardia transvalensis]